MKEPMARISASLGIAAPMKAEAIAGLKAAEGM
jgi:hypothetical protein